MNQTLLGTKIKELRISQKLSQEKLAQRIGALPQSVLSRIESNEHVPSEAALKVLCDALTKNKAESKKLFGDLSTRAKALHDLHASRAAEKSLARAKQREDSKQKGLGARIVRFREAQKWSRAELARNAGIHQNHLGLIENDRVTPSDPTLQAIAKALSVTVEVLRPPQQNGNLRMVKLAGQYEISDVQRILHITAKKGLPLIAVCVHRNEKQEPLFTLYEGSQAMIPSSVPPHPRRRASDMQPAAAQLQ